METVKKNVTLSQLMFLYLLMLFSPSVRLFPLTANIADNVAWLTPLPALAAFVIYLLCVSTIYKPYIHKHVSICDIFIDIFGKIAGKALLCLALAMSLFLAAFELRYYSERLSTVLYSNLPFQILIFFFVIILLIVFKKGFAVTARMGQLLFVVMLIIFLVTFIFTIDNFDLRNLVPITTMDIKPVIKGSLVVISLYTYILPLLVMSDYVDDLSQIKKKSLLTVSLLTFLSILIIIMCISTLGSSLTARMPFPYMSSIKLIKIFGTVERIESAVSAITMWSDFALVAVLAFSCMNILKRLIPIKNILLIGSMVVMMIYALSLLICQSKYELELLSSELIQPLFVAISFSLVFLLLIVGKLRRKI